MGVHSPCRGVLLGFWVSLLFAASFCDGNDKTIEVVGIGECADCEENNIKTSHAFSGLRVTIDCKAENGELKTRGSGKLDEEGKFKVSLPQEILKDGELNEECFAQLHSASAAPCPAHSGLEASKITFTSKNNDKQILGPAGKLTFSSALCSSAFAFHYFYPPPPKLSFPPPEPMYKKPLPPPVPIYKKPLPPPVPVFKKPLPPPVPVYKKLIPPPVPTFKKPIPSPIPIYKPKPKPPLFKPKHPFFKHPPVPIYKKPFPPPFPIYKPKPPIFKLPPVPKYKKPCPPPIPIYKPKPSIPIYKPKPPTFKHPIKVFPPPIPM